MLSLEITHRTVKFSTVYAITWFSPRYFPKGHRRLLVTLFSIISAWAVGDTSRLLWFPITIRQTRESPDESRKGAIRRFGASDAGSQFEIVTQVKHLQIARPLSLKV
jgi:Na+/H+ antiporter NhaD/arsenite permease-like protein